MNETDFLAQTAINGQFSIRAAEAAFEEYGLSNDMNQERSMTSIPMEAKDKNIYKILMGLSLVF